MLPTDIDSLAGWWRASDLGLADGAAVTSWAPVPGSGGPTVNDPGATTPTFTTTRSLNGLPGVEYLGAAQLRELTAGTLAGYANSLPGMSMFIVCVLDAGVGGNNSLFQVTTPSTATSRFAMRVDITGKLSVVARVTDGGAAVITAGGATLAMGTPYVISGTHDFSAATAHAALNGTTQVTGSALHAPGLAGATDTAALALASTATTAEAIRGVAYEIIAYRRALSASERARVHSYLSDRYGITVADYVPDPAEPLTVADVAALAAAVPSSEVGSVGESLVVAVMSDRPGRATLGVGSSASVRSGEWS